jgi:hypothetical protein
MRYFAAFCHEEDIYPLQATTKSIVRNFLQEKAVGATKQAKKRNEEQTG